MQPPNRVYSNMMVLIVKNYVSRVGTVEKNKKYVPETLLEPSQAMEQSKLPKLEILILRITGHMSLLNLIFTV